MLRLKMEGFEILPERKIIKAEEYAAVLKAQAIITAAEEEAAQIVTEAKASFEEEKRRGFKEGKQAGEEEMTAHMLDYVTKTVENYEQFEDKILDVVMQAVKQIIGELDQKELVKQVTHKVLDMARNQKQVTLRVPSDQCSYMKGEINKILKAFPTVNFVDVVPDERLTSGDCILETELGVIDGRIEVQLEALRKSFQNMIK